MQANSELSFCHRPLPSPIINLTDLRRSGSRAETENAVAAIDFCYTIIDIWRSWPGKFGQVDKWILCLTAARIVAANQERR